MAVAGAYHGDDGLRHGGGAPSTLHQAVRASTGKERYVAEDMNTCTHSLQCSLQHMPIHCPREPKLQLLL